MAWTAPRTWVTNEVVSAAIMNTHVRDNLLALGALGFLRQRVTSTPLASDVNITSASDTDATGLSVSITVIASSRIVARLMTANDSVANQHIHSRIASGGPFVENGLNLRALYGATSMGRRGAYITFASTSSQQFRLPHSSFIWEAVPGAGTYTVKIQGAATTANYELRFPTGTYLSVEEWGPVA